MEIVLPLALVAVLAALALAGLRKAWRRAEVSPWEVGLVYGPRGFVKELPPGRHDRFDPLDRTRVLTVATVTRTLPGQVVDAISADQFAFRLTLTPVVTAIDPRALVENSTGAIGNEYRYDRIGPALSAAALTAVAGRTLEEFLAAPGAIVEAIRPTLAEALPGTRLDDLLLTAITLPPEVRKMFTEVERARREGLAGLERARAEQASLRALANAARNLADNPALAQLRLLQVMENAKGAKTFVLGSQSGDGQQPGSGSLPGD